MLQSHGRNAALRRQKLMAISLALVKQIASMFIIMFFGFLTIRLKALTMENSKVISKLTIYVVAPCCLISSFQIDYSPDKLTGLLLSLGCALFIHILYIGLTKSVEKPFKLTGLERASVIYPNSVNLIIPLIVAVLGKEWVFYSSGFMIVQNIIVWTHGKSVVCGERQRDFKSIITNVNIIAIFVGLILFLTRLQLPVIVKNSFEAVGDMLGPLSMLVIGMLLGNMRLKEIMGNKRAYFIVFLRLVALPLIATVILGLSHISGLHPEGKNILLITVMSASSAAAATVTQFAQLYDKTPAYAGVINVMSVLLCIITMPLMVALFQLF
jgi:predicted permease